MCALSADADPVVSARRGVAQAAHHIGQRSQAGGSPGEAHLRPGLAGQEGACRGGRKVRYIFGVPGWWGTIYGLVRVPPSGAPSGGKCAGVGGLDVRMSGRGTTMK